MTPKSLTTGKPIMPKVLNGTSTQIINDRLVDEYTAHFFYRNATNWCKGAGYNNAAAFFEKEAENELEHAKKLQQYLVDWNVNPTMPAVKPNINLMNLIDIVNKAYLLEYDLYEKYNADSLRLMTTDITTYDLFTDFRKTQFESVVEYSDLLNAAMLVDTTNRLDIIHFEELYFKA